MADQNQLINPQTGSTYSNELSKWVSENSGKAIAGAVGVAMLAAPAVIGGAFLGAVGFGVAGPALGSLAATLQVSNVAAGGWFAVCQSAGMGGTGAAAINGIVQAVGGLVAATAAAAAAVTSDDKDPEKDAEEKDKEQVEQPLG